MGLFSTFMDEFRISKRVAELANSVPMLTGSREERDTVKRVVRLWIEVGDILRDLDDRCDASTRASVATWIRDLVLKVPRGKEGHSTLVDLEQKMRTERDIRHTAPWVARLLVAADFECECAKGNGLSSMAVVVMIQSDIENFLERNGSKGWGVPIVESSRFDELRSR